MEEKRRRSKKHLKRPEEELTRAREPRRAGGGSGARFSAIPFAVPAPYAGPRRKASPVRVADSEAALAEAYFESALRVLAECSTVADRAIDQATELLDSLRTSV